MQRANNSHCQHAMLSLAKKLVSRIVLPTVVRDQAVTGR
jgi:hypothetical protein